MDLPLALGLKSEPEIHFKSTGKTRLPGLRNIFFRSIGNTSLQTCGLLYRPCATKMGIIEKTNNKISFNIIIHAAAYPVKEK
jgi:hypothetical protein